jgi:hypothetical protein
MTAPVLTLGGISLDPSMAWIDRDASQGVAQSVTRTLGGGIIVQSVGLQAGREITLASGSDFGMLRWPAVQALHALADQAGAVHTLDVDGTEYSVMFRHSDPPAFSAEPLIARIAPFDLDYYRCTIKLITV